MRTSPRDPARQSGFTLLELLVAMTLLGLLLAMVAGGMRLVGAGWTRGEEHLAGTDALYRAQVLLHRQLARAFRLPLPPDGLLAFEGGPRLLDFAVVEPPRPLAGGLHLVRLEVAEDARGARLLQRRLPAALAEEGFVALRGAPPVTLIEGPYRLAFDYFGRLAEEEQERWVEEWPPGRRLPLLVRLTVTDRRTGAAVAPDLVARPALQAEAACLTREPAGFCSVPRQAGR